MGSNERTCEIPRIYTQREGADSASLDTSLRCSKVVDKGGITPSEAHFAFYPGDIGDDVTGPTVLNLVKDEALIEDDDTLILESGDSLGLDPDALKHGARVLVARSSTDQMPYFLGWIRNRKDQLALNTTTYSAEDDKILLSYIPIRGAFIRDEDDGGTALLKYSASHPTSFNPKGAWNCTGIEIGPVDSKVTYPVFTSVAYRARSYVEPDTTFGDTLPTDGSIVPWTPRRALQYLWFVANAKFVVEGLGSSTLPTNYYGTFLRSKAHDNPYLIWEWFRMRKGPYGTGGMTGVDTGTETVDPLDKILESMSIQGDMCLGAINKILNAVGTHTLILENSTLTGTDSAKLGVSNVVFYPTGATAQSSGSHEYIDCQVNGGSDFDSGDLIDFTVSEDSSGTIGHMMVEGSTVNVETRVQWDGTPLTSTIVPAWTDAEEIAFLNIIYGGTPSSHNTHYCTVPPVFSNTDVASYLDADGNDGRPLVFTMTPEAFALARANFPTVFRAWKLNTTDMVVAGLEDSGSTEWLLNSRPVLERQLQYYVADSALSVSGDTRSLTTLPIRMELEQVGIPGKFLPCSRNLEVRVTAQEDGDCFLWLDGIAENLDTSTGQLQECIYYPSMHYVSTYEDDMIIAGGNITTRAFKLKNFRMNLAFPSERRVIGRFSATFARGETCDMAWLDRSLGRALDSTEMEAVAPVNLFSYFDAGQSYRADYQYNSYPGIVSKYYGGTTGLVVNGSASGMTGWLPPGNEAIHAEYAAKRRLIRGRNIRRTSDWKIFGLNAGTSLGVRGGIWLKHVQFRDTVTGLASYYVVDGTIGEVTFNFLDQTMTVGGVVSQEYL